jgi:hypothetical protein
MMRFPWLSRRLAIGVAVLALTLGGSLLEPAGVLAGAGGSPGAPTFFMRCSGGEHFPEAT